ncbi:hypothetical protein BC830DRAFT_548386 [Chytriomyces sp. MP71]|nr:hypothetical protein BC830DRAFT_548386 [Chytriomyces sp. MP71]
MDPLPCLTGLFVGKNKLSGAIDHVCVLTGLRHLALFETLFTGSIPPQLPSCLSHLTLLSLEKNQLTGIIPEDIGALAQLRVLNLSFNQLTGPVANSICELKLCEEIDLSHNELDGFIPARIGDLGERLMWLHLSHNSLDQSLPDSIYELTQLEELNISSNKLNGVVDFRVRAFLNLEFLGLSGNRFTFIDKESVFSLPLLCDYN